VFDAIVLAGGAGTRLGGVEKPQLEVSGRTLLDHVVAALSDAERVIVVGPRQPVLRPVTFCRENPPGGGPVAAIAAGVPHTHAEIVVVLAADLPWIGPAIPMLLAALPATGMAMLTDRDGRGNYLAAAWRRRDLVGALARLGDPAGVSARALAELVDHVRVADTGGWGRDCDTWDDLAEARSHREDR
jgi:molybdopterin-guanine dinucleotide biosynthesis protein A